MQDLKKTVFCQRSSKDFGILFCYFHGALGKLSKALVFILVMSSTNAASQSISPQLLEELKSLPRSEQIVLAQKYGFDLDEYFHDWNSSSTIMLQIESIEGVRNIDELIAFDEIDGVMIGPLDLSGSLGVPGNVEHPLVIEASTHVISACRKRGISCGTQLSNVSAEGVQRLIDLGYTYVILGSDLFVLCQWAKDMRNLVQSFKTTT